MACIEHATQLDPAVRAGGVPRRRAPATAHLRRSASPGRRRPVIQHRRLGEPGEGETDAVVRTAGRIGTDAAIPFLARFCGLPGAEYALPQQWSNFDTDAYFSEVIARLPADKSTFFASSRKELTLLGRKGHTDQVRVEGNFTEAELTAALRDNQVRELTIAYNTEIRDLALLHDAFPDLVDLGLVECPAITDLAPLSRWPLQHLSLIKVDGVSSLDALASLDSLTSLLLNMPWPADPRGIPRSLPLEFLSLTGAPAEGGMDDITAWPGLRNVALWQGCPGPEGWRRLAALPSLETLQVPVSALEALSGANVRLTSVRTLHLTAEGDLPLTTVTEAFPALQELSLYARHVTNRTVDVSPLAALADLSHLHVHDSTPVNVGRLSATVEAR